ncbi:MAG TPA: murein L,D-transpeptidase catalytic domain family protein [Nevskiales bacterium]|nr:murein L,D-transpeptidase catalytic domain family protein [Nevskiales bacterium]
MPRFVRWMAAAGLLLVCVPAGAQPSAIAVPPEFLEPLLQKYQEVRKRLGNARHVALLNYRQPSWEPRFHIIDPGTRKILRSYVVAHGRGSDPEHTGYARRFSDEPESHQSSLGFFLTGDTYVSESKGHGLSMRLVGLSETNRNAMHRAIVIHSNWYMDPGFLAQHRKPGRSYGCLVFSDRDRDEVVDKLKGGALIYAAY